MPELPEVETVRRDLEEHLVGRTINAVCVSREDILRSTDAAGLTAALTRSEVLSTGRLGKNLIVELSGGRAVLVNLGMTGQLFVCDTATEIDEHAHLVADLGDGIRLVFRDVRRFGHIELASAAGIGESFTLRNVGTDAMSDEFTPARLAEVLEGRDALLKGALLDQRGVAGLGNIYVCEALFRARISPHAKCRDLSAAQVKKLHGAIRNVLSESIAAEGTTISDYVTGRGVPGGFQRRLRVYGRQGERCLRRGCGGTIERIVQSNRPTFFCPKCQNARETNRGESS